jgi:hypothetical protein
VYSFGILMHELLFEREPFPPPNDGFGNMWYLGLEIANSDLRPLIPESDYSEQESKYIDIMQQCWKKTPMDRPSFDEIGVALANLKS